MKEPNEEDRIRKLEARVFELESLLTELQNDLFNTKGKLSQLIIVLLSEKFKDENI
jgi:hypothetical protein